MMFSWFGPVFLVLSTVESAVVPLADTLPMNLSPFPAPSWPF